MKVLVTGGAGFIGSNFIRFILEKYPKYEIINLDKLTYAGNLDNLRDIEKNQRYKFIKGDICDEKLVNDIVKNVDVIINFAAESHVDRSISKADDFIRTDIYGTFVLLEAAKNHKISKFVQISTDEVYGSIKEGASREDSQLMPSSPYSASKAGADRLAFSYWATYKLPVVIVRSSNNFGPYQYPEKLIPLFITNLLEGIQVPLYGDGLNKRDWIYVIDNCEAIDFIMHNGELGEVYNVGAGNERTNIEITKILLQALEKGEEMIEFVKDRPGHDRRYALDCSKVNALGWKPRFEFKHAMKETVEWYKNNRWWWEKIKSGEHYKSYYQKQYK